MDGAALKKMVEYRKVLDSNREITLSVGLNKATHGKRSAAISDDEDTELRHKKIEKKKKKLKSKSRSKKGSNQSLPTSCEDGGGGEYAAFLRVRGPVENRVGENRAETRRRWREWYH